MLHRILQPLTQKTPHALRWLLAPAVAAVLTYLGSKVSVPVPGADTPPFTLQSMVVVLAGLVLGPARGMTASGLYLGAGAFGLPVFAGGASGIDHLTGDTGGFLFGFLGTSWLAGMIADTKASWMRVLSAGLASQGALFAVGAAWLIWSQQREVGRGLADLAPLLIGLALKALLIVGVIAGVRRLLSRWLN